MNRIKLRTASECLLRSVSRDEDIVALHIARELQKVISRGEISLVERVHASHDPAFESLIRLYRKNSAYLITASRIPSRKVRSEPCAKAFILWVYDDLARRSHAW